MFATRTPLRLSDVLIRAAIVGLALATGYIHLTLGGLLFTLNAIGYFTAAVAMIIPLALAVRFRWFIRLGLMGYAATTIIAWAIQGPYFQLAYIAKGIEVTLIALLIIDFARHDGNPVNVVKAELANLSTFVAKARGTAGANAGLAAFELPTLFGVTGTVPDTADSDASGRRDAGGRRARARGSAPARHRRKWASRRSLFALNAERLSRSKGSSRLYG